MSLQIEERIKSVIGNVFGIDPNDVNEETSLDTIEKWTSLGQMNLVMALEEEFNFQFSDEQVLEMMSYPLIVCVIKETLSSQ